MTDQTPSDDQDRWIAVGRWVAERCPEQPEEPEPLFRCGSAQNAAMVARIHNDLLDRAVTAEARVVNLRATMGERIAAAEKIAADVMGERDAAEARVAALEDAIREAVEEFELFGLRGVHERFADLRGALATDPTPEADRA